MSFALPIRVYWEDTDAGGIVFYANYLKFMERARTEWLRAAGIEQRRLHQDSGGLFVVSETTLKYHRPAHLDDQLVVTADLQQMGAASMTIGQRVLLKSAQNDVAPASSLMPLLCEGTIRIGWVDGATLRPTRMPTQVSGTLERFGRSMSQPLTP